MEIMAKVTYLHGAVLPSRSTGWTSAVLFWKDSNFSNYKDSNHCLMTRGNVLSWVHDSTGWKVSLKHLCWDVIHQINQHSVIVNWIITEVYVLSRCGWRTSACLQERYPSVRWSCQEQDHHSVPHPPPCGWGSPSCQMDPSRNSEGA